MRGVVIGLALACACAAKSATPPPAPAPPSPIPPAATQLVLVTAKDWDVTAATLQRYEREGDGWRSVGGEIPAVLGRSGLAWGKGLHGEGAPAGRTGPVKKEGDGRSTAGVFRLGAVYGRDPVAPTGARAAYAPLTESWRCVDDGRSPYYNRVLDSAGVTPDWSSAEDMWAIGPLYDLLVVIEHNVPAVPGAGSCIFLHVWRSQDDPTAGCAAIAKPSLSELIAWLRPNEAIYVALPAAEAAALKRGWRLP